MTVAKDYDDDDDDDNDVPLRRDSSRVPACGARSNTAIIAWKTPPPALRPPPVQPPAATAVPSNPSSPRGHTAAAARVAALRPNRRRQLSSPETHISTAREKPNL